MLAARLSLGPASDSGRPLGCLALARSRHLGFSSYTLRLPAPIAAGSASEEWERRQDASDSTERRGQRRRQGGEGRHPGHDRLNGQRSGGANPCSQHSTGGSTGRERSSCSSRNSRQRRTDSSRPPPAQQGQQRPWEDHRPIMAALGRCSSCADVWQLVLEEDAKAGSWQVHPHVLASGLDNMKKKAACEDGSEADRRAVAQLLQLATERLCEFEPRELVAFIRCAAAFKGVLQPEQLAAWQAAAQPHKLRKASSQDVSNMLLSLGTLAESDERLAAVVSGRLPERLLQHAAELAAAGKLGPLQHAANCFYGAALLGLQPTAAQAGALFGAVQLALEQPQQRGDHIAVTQVLLACTKLADVQPEAGASPAPDEDPFHLFYPGASLVDALLRIATSAPLDLQAVTQLVGACGALLHMPPPQQGAALLAGGLRAAGSAPRARCIEACVAAVEREGPSSVRQASNIAWALAVLEVCDLLTWQRLVALVAIDVASLADAALMQWAQAHQLMQLRHGQSVPCPPELLQRSQTAWAAHLQQQQEQQQHGKAVSRFERLLAAAVAEMAGGHAVQPAHIAAGSSGEPLALVDVALPQSRIAVEADGPTHFLRNRQGGSGQPLRDGPTRTRDRLLEGHGWRVVSVPHLEYARLAAAGATDAKLQAGLRRYLEERTGLAAAIAEKTTA